MAVPLDAGTDGVPAPPEITVPPPVDLQGSQATIKGRREPPEVVPLSCIDGGQVVQIGALEEGIGGDTDAGTNDATQIFALDRNAIESGGRPEIDDDARASIFFERGHSVHNAVGTDLRGVVVMHGHSGFHAGLDEEGLEIEITLADLA